MRKRRLSIPLIIFRLLTYDQGCSKVVIRANQHKKGAQALGKKAFIHSCRISPPSVKFYLQPRAIMKKRNWQDERSTKHADIAASSHPFRPENLPMNHGHLPYPLIVPYKSKI